MRTDDMSNDPESWLRQLLKNVLREVAAEFMDEWKANARHQSPQSTPAVDGYLLTPRETAKRLAISERHLFQLTRSGQLPCVRVGKCVRYNIETIQKWVREIESKDQPSTARKDASKQVAAAPKPTVTTSPRRKRNNAARQGQQGSANEKKSVSERRSPEVRQRVLNGRPQEAESDERIRPLNVLLSELGIEMSSLPPITNGELRQITEVDIATMHGWLYLNGSLPQEAMDRLKNYFRSLVNEGQNVE